MFKKTEPDAFPGTPRTPSGVAPRPERSQHRATIGPSISIKGDLTGEEDLFIEGTVEGEIRLEKHSITVGRDGRVKADVYGKSIRVEGEVEGNLRGEEEIVIRASGRVRGNLVAPRVSLEDGASFKGSIDMESRAKKLEGAGAAGSSGDSAAHEAKNAQKPRTDSDNKPPAAPGPRPAAARS